MKTRFKSIAIKSLICLGAMTVFLSCNDDEFFELRDRTGIDAAIWDNEGSIDLHLARAYDVCIPQWTFLPSPNSTPPDRWQVHYASDENCFPAQEQLARRALGMEPTNPLLNNDVRYVGNKYDFNVGSNKYFDISRCNVAIKNIPLGALPREKQDVLLGQYYALRALTYFDLAKVYGGVPLILEPVDIENIQVDGRNSAKEVFQSVLTDLDSAISKLDGVEWADKTGRGRISKKIAIAIKARVLLYWASPQFNPLDNAAHPHDASRWQTAFDANKEAYDLCIEEGHSLVPKYADIFRLEGSANPEAILARTYSNTLQRRGTNVEQLGRPNSAGGNSYWGFVATKKLLDTYPMKDGNPITSASEEYPYDDVMFWVNRDPRFEATIAYNGSDWPLNAEPSRRQWNYAGAVLETNNVRGVYCKRFTLPDLLQANVPITQNVGGSGMDWIELRLAEVMLNYAECANEINELEIAKDMVRQIRIRAGIEAGANDYGLGSVDKTQMRELIMNERMIEFAFENKRNADLRRTRSMHLLEGNMQTVSFEVVGANAAAQKATRDALEAIVPETGKRFRDGLDIDDKDTYLTYFKPYIITNINATYGPYAVPEHHYFYTFHNDFVNRGKNIEPTIGWDGGTFDPLAE